MVQQQHLRSLTDLSQVAEGVRLRRNRPAVHSQPDAVWATRSLGRAIIQIPDLNSSLIIPLIPETIVLVIPVLRSRERLSVLVLKLARAVFAITDVCSRQPAPAVIGKAIGMAALDDLRKNIRQVSLVIIAV